MQFRLSLFLIALSLYCLHSSFTWFLGTWFFSRKKNEILNVRQVQMQKKSCNHRDNTTLVQMCICNITVLLFSDHVPSHSQYFFFRYTTNVYIHKSPSSYTQFQSHSTFTKWRGKSPIFVAEHALDPMVIKL